MNTSKTPNKLTRGQLREALETVPTDSLFSPAVSRELTGKQKKFAREVAMGATKADAYRKAYNAKSPHTMASKPYHLAADDRVKLEIEAIKRAIAAQEYQTPAALRALVIQSLVGVITNPDSQPGQITAAAKVLGTVTEVAAFTARSEHKVIRSSDDTRAELMAQIRELSNADAVDVTVNDDADSLMAELNSVGDETHPPPTPLEPEAESLAYIHTIPHERSSLESIPHEQPASFSDPSDPTPSTQDDPPSPS